MIRSNSRKFFHLFLIHVFGFGAYFSMDFFPPEFVNTVNWIVRLGCLVAFIVFIIPRAWAQFKDANGLYPLKLVIMCIILGVFYALVNILLARSGVLDEGVVWNANTITYFCVSVSWMITYWKKE